MAIVGFPDGTRVRASSISDRCVDDPGRTFGLYLDARWEPTWPATVIDWEDVGLPENPALAAQQIAEAFGRARRGELVEVGCLGGSGRTGTVLACMAVLAGVPPDEAVAWVRASYRPEAVETADGCGGLPNGRTPIPTRARVMPASGDIAEHWPRRGYCRLAIPFSWREP